MYWGTRLDYLSLTLGTLLGALLMLDSPVRGYYLVIMLSAISLGALIQHVWRILRWFKKLRERMRPIPLGCRMCQQLYDLEPCVVCGRSVCPRHRASPGSIRHYMCTEGECMIRFWGCA